MRLIAFFTLLLAALAPAQIAFGQNYWEPLAGPYGISYGDMAATDDGKIYLISRNGEVFRSLDNGDSWQHFEQGLSNPGSYPVLVASAPGGKAYLLAGHEFYRLSNDGNAWVQFPFPPFSGAQSLFANPQGHVFVQESPFGHIYRSTDGGQSFHIWLEDGALDGVFGAHFSFNGNGLNFAAVSEIIAWNVYRISDDGTQVTLLLNEEEMWVNGLIYHPSGKLLLSGDEKVLFSNDEGASWDTLSGAPSNISSMSMNEAGDLFVQVGQDIYVSHDAGNTWDFMISPPPGLSEYFGIAVLSDDVYALQTSCPGEVFLRTTDGGATWENMAEKFAVPYVESIFKDAGGNLYAFTCEGETMLRSADEGETWQPHFLSNGSSARFLTSNSQGYLFAISGDGYSADTLLRSTDGGNTWENISLPGFPYITWLAATGQSGLYAANYEFIYQSYDNGDTWTLLNIPLNYPEFITLHPDGSLYVAEAFVGIFRSQDGGLTWEQVVGGGFDEVIILAIHATAKGDIYVSMSDDAMGDYGLFRSSDHMETWQKVSDYLPYKIFSDAESDVFIYTGDAIYQTEDDGATWNSFDEGLSEIERVNTFYLSDDQYIYTCLSGNVIHKTALPVAERNLVKGNIWFDENENCQPDPGEPPLPGWLIKANSGSDQFVRSAGFDGSFTMTLPTGDHVLNPLLPNNLWENTCASQGVGVSFPGSGDTAFVDFPISAAQLCPLLTVDLSTPLLRRCFENAYTVKVCNRGTAQATNAEVDVTLDSFFIFQSATAPLLAQNGNTYTFSVGNLNVSECRTFKVLVTVSCDASLGQEHCMSAWLDQDPTCPNLPTAAARECQANIGSFDPNDKMALVEGSPESDWVHPNTDLEFHIRFQNTGTDTAFNVVVEDQLSSWLDPATIQPGASSHPYFFEMNETGRLLFHFDAILLPDSNINEPASHGFVKFKVSQKPNVPFGSYIQNQASIFFDFNPAVLTNLVKLHVGQPDATGERRERYEVLAFPNPFENSTRLKISGLDGQKLRLRLFDARGALQRQVEFSAPEIEVKREGLASGLYFFCIEKEGEQVGCEKLIVR